MHLWSTITTVNDKTPFNDTHFIINSIGFKIISTLYETGKYRQHLLLTILYIITRNHLEINDINDIIQLIFLVTTITRDSSERFPLPMEPSFIYKRFHNFSSSPSTNKFDTKYPWLREIQKTNPLFSEEIITTN